MGIVFFCQSCGSRFEVDPRLAGKRGHCKKCGQPMMIPRADEIASMSGMPALAMAGAGAAVAGAGGGAGAAVGSSIASWLKAGISGAALAPITLDRVPRPTRPSALDDAEDSKPYVLAQPVRETRGRATQQASAALNVWRRQLGGIQKIFRKISQAAYLISVPFLMILLLGVAVKSRPMALLGATAVVLLNIGRLVAGAANLAVVPLRDGVNVRKLKKPVWRVAEPALTIVLVVLAFTFIPWLSRGQSAGGSIADRIRSGAQDLKKEMKSEVKRVADVDQLGAQAQQKLQQLGDKARELDIQNLGGQAQEKLKELAPSSGSPTKTSSPGGGSRGEIRP